jgi:hypothetical protein
MTAVEPKTDNPPPVVQIVGPTDGWVLERQAKILTAKLPYAEFVSNHPSPGKETALVYYFNYALYKEPSGRIDVGFFTHRDDAQGFLDKARRVDCCVCMARQYADWLRGEGVRDVIHIPMGFDAYRYRPTLVLGVVGRLAHPRKGGALVERVRALPFVEMVVSDGQLQEGQLRNLYHLVDYVLISSTIEGGPMCLLEGLGMGKPVIAPEGVGLVSEFASAAGVLLYPAGDAAALVGLVTRCYEEKRLRSSVVGGRTWDDWAEAHHRQFMRLFRERGIESPRPGPGFRFGMMSELSIPAAADTGPLEAAIDRATAHLFYGRLTDAHGELSRMVGHYPYLKTLMRTLLSTTGRASDAPSRAGATPAVQRRPSDDRSAGRPP